MRGWPIPPSFGGVGGVRLCCDNPAVCRAPQLRALLLNANPGEFTRPGRDGISQPSVSTLGAPATKPESRSRFTGAGTAHDRPLRFTGTSFQPSPWAGTGDWGARADE